jgi:hypothetical protein
MNNESSILNDADLEQVAGGLECGPATVVAGVYLAAAKFESIMGDSTTAATYSGQAMGVMQGACTGKGK